MCVINLNALGFSFWSNLSILLVCCDFLSCCNYVRTVLKSENKLDSLVAAKQLGN